MFTIAGPDGNGYILTIDNQMKVQVEDPTRDELIKHVSDRLFELSWVRMVKPLTTIPITLHDDVSHPRFFEFDVRTSEIKDLDDVDAKVATIRAIEGVSYAYATQRLLYAWDIDLAILTKRWGGIRTKASA